MKTSSFCLFLALLARQAVSLPAAPAGQIPYTFYQLELQDQLEINTASIKGKEYESFFRPDLFVYPEMIEPGRLAIDCATEAMNPDFSDINALLAPANVQLAHENAWCAYKDGQGFVASRSHWPGVTKDMITWWFWWHSKESARYSLWHPWAHKSISSTYADKFDDPSLNNTEKLLGSVHHITEIIGSDEQTIDIHWKRPSFFGIDETKFEENGIVASASGQIYEGNNTPLKAVDMIHLWYETDEGLELRSRYYLANNVQLKIPILGQLFPIDKLGSLLGIKKAIVGRSLSFLQFHHDQQEMTHLASILPELYQKFGHGAK